VLVTRGGVDGYQFKSSESDGFLIFGQLLASQRTRSGGPAASLVRALADGLILLRRQYNVPVRVHLVTRLFASPRDHLADATDQVSPDHFQAFIAQVLARLRLTPSRSALTWPFPYLAGTWACSRRDPRS